MNNKVLLLIFGILLTVYVCSQFKGKDKSRSFSENIVSIDSSLVDKIEVIQKEMTFQLIKENNGWSIVRNGIHKRALLPAVHSLVNDVSEIKAKKVFWVTLIQAVTHITATTHITSPPHITTITLITTLHILHQPQV